MAFISYSVQTAVIMGIFCAVYHLFFRRLTFFTINRYFLIFSLLLSLAIPLVKVEVEEPIILDPVSDIGTVYTKRIQQEVLKTPEYKVSEVRLSESRSEFLDLKTILWTAYGAVSSILLLRLFYSLTRLIYKAQSGTKAKGFIWIHPFAHFNNCSFFNLLIVDSTKLSKFELEQVLAHENQHKKKLHSLDQLVIEIIIVFFWFNPFIYFYKNAIHAVHEFEVDQWLSDRIDKQSYGNLLLKLASPSTALLTRGFSQSSLRRRIEYLFKKRSNRYKKAAYTVTVPLIVFFVSLFSFQKVRAIETIIHLPSLQKPEPVPTMQKTSSNLRPQTVVAIKKHFLEKAASLELSDVIKPLFSGELPPVASAEESLAPKTLTVILDPGHGGKDHGGSFRGVYEKELVLQIAKRLKEALEKENFNVKLTREADEFVALKDRVAFEGDVFVSLHVNLSPQKNKSTTQNGMEIFIPNRFVLKDSMLLSKSLDLASYVKRGLSSLDISMREDFKDISLFVLNHTRKPAVLLELGFLNNTRDFDLLTNDQYQKELARNFASALNNYRLK